LILGRPEPEGDAADVFYDPVEALDTGVGQAGLNGQDHWFLPAGAAAVCADR
jgi:hypothetical protein